MNKEHIFNNVLGAIDVDINSAMCVAPCNLEQHKERQESLEQLVELRREMMDKAVQTIHG